jgi:hypothetical protein
LWYNRAAVTYEDEFECERQDETHNTVLSVNYVLLRLKTPSVYLEIHLSDTQRFKQRLFGDMCLVVADLST